MDWRRQVGRAADLGFDHVCAGPIFAAGRDPFLIADLETTDPKLGMAGSPEDVVGGLAALCAAQGLPLFLDIVLDRLAADGSNARAANGLYEWRDHGDVVDPRHDQGFAQAAPVRADAGERLAVWWAEHLARLARAGAAGFRLVGLDLLSNDALPRIVGATRHRTPAALGASR